MFRDRRSGALPKGCPTITGQDRWMPFGTLRQTASTNGRSMTYTPEIDHPLVCSVLRLRKHSLSCNLDSRSEDKRRLVGFEPLLHWDEARPEAFRAAIIRVDDGATDFSTVGCCWIHVSLDADVGEDALSLIFTKPGREATVGPAGFETDSRHPRPNGPGSPAKSPRIFIVCES
jgi:hypothetical protein